MRHRVLAVVTAFAVSLLGCSSLPPARQISSPSEQLDNQPQRLPVTAMAAIGEAEIKLEVARTPEQMAKGLMFRSELAGDRGMLFPVEPEQAVEFWMKNVQMPLDIIFIRDGQVQNIVASAPTCDGSSGFCPQFSSGGPVDQVIEVPAGTAQALGLGVGDSVEIIALESTE